MIRWRLVVLGAALCVAAFLGVIAFEQGLTDSWPSAGRAIWAFGLIALVLAGVMVAATGLGRTSPEKLAELYEGETRALRPWQMGVVYIGFIIGAVWVSIVLEERFELEDPKGALIVGGFAFLLAATRRPWWWFATLRRLGWFAAIESDASMRLILVGLGLLLLVGSVVPVSF